MSTEGSASGGGVLGCCGCGAMGCCDVGLGRTGQDEANLEPETRDPGRRILGACFSRERDDADDRRNFEDFKL